jgi:hypothetical protein
MRNECQARLVRHNPPLVNVIYRKMEKCQNLPDCQPLIMHIVHVAQLLSKYENENYLAACKDEKHSKKNSSPTFNYQIGYRLITSTGS